jgi:hypothetical protein
MAELRHTSYGEAEVGASGPQATGCSCAILVVGGLVFWLLRPSADTPNTASTTPTTTTAPASPSPDVDGADPVARDQL